MTANGDDPRSQFMDEARRGLEKAHEQLGSFLQAVTGMLTWTTVLGAGLLVWAAEKTPELDAGERCKALVGAAAIGLSFVPALWMGYQTLRTWDGLRQLYWEVAGVWHRISSAEWPSEAGPPAEVVDAEMEELRRRSGPALHKARPGPSRCWLLAHMVLLLAGLALLLWAQVGDAIAQPVLSPLLP
jgi:hypothetical protein